MGEEREDDDMVDFHTHTVYSDGKKTPEFVIREAVRKGLSYLAITDHNYLHENIDEIREQHKGEIHLINGLELSTKYDAADGKCQEVHVVGLNVDNHRMKEVVDSVTSDRRTYFEAKRKKLKENCNIIVPDYDQFQKMYPESRKIGSVSIADYMTRHGMVSSIDEAFRVYFGRVGERRAYVDALDYCHYVKFEDGIRAILEAGGIPILAHLFTYHYDEQENLRMVKRFKDAAGGHDAGMEVFYKKYTKQQQKELSKIADQFHLLYSSASDFHGKTDQETLMDPDHLKDCPLEKHVVSLFMDGMENRR